MTLKPRDIAERDNYLCGECGEPVDKYENWEIDHILPRKLGGDDSPGNKQIVHFRCHKTKSKTDVGRIAKGKRQASKQEFHDQVMAGETTRKNKTQRELEKWKARQIEPLAKRQE